MDHYNTLGVSRDATQDDIKKAYRKLAMKHHPDRGGDPDEFKQLGEAYAVLSDSQKRQIYDMGGQPGHRTYTGDWQRGGVDMDDIMRQFHDVFGRGFGMGGGPRGRVRNPDAVADIEITLQEAFTGVNKVITTDSINEVLELPAGVQSGTRFRIHGKGPRRHQDAPPGDLLIRISVKNPPGVERQGDALIHRVQINAVQAMAGGEITLQHISGKTIRTQMAAGTQPGARLRLRGMGMPNPHTGHPGDLFILVDVHVPTVTDPEHVRLLNNIINPQGDHDEL